MRAGVRAFLVPATVLGHLRGRVKPWDVVKGALRGSPGELLRQTRWQQAIGGDFAEAFFAVRQAAR